MNTMYLRMPKYVADFHRARDESHALLHAEPVVFCEFSRQYVILSTCLRILSPQMQTQCHCYSQRAWRNICNGRPPRGGFQIFRRDPKEWPSQQEVCTLEGTRQMVYPESVDYICIGLPREVLVGQTVHRVNASYSLDATSASQLCTLLRNEFYMTLLDWLIQDRRYCNQQGIHRTRIESFERFLARYNISVSSNNRERNSLRRMANRWLRAAYALTNDRVDFGEKFWFTKSDAEDGVLEEPIYRNDKKR